MDKILTCQIIIYFYIKLLPLSKVAKDEVGVGTRGVVPICEGIRGVVLVDCGRIDEDHPISFDLAVAVGVACAPPILEDHPVGAVGVACVPPILLDQSVCVGVILCTTHIRGPICGCGLCTSYIRGPVCCSGCGLCTTHIRGPSCWCRCGLHVSNIRGPACLCWL